MLSGNCCAFTERTLPEISVYQDRDSPEGGMSRPCPLRVKSGKAQNEQMLSAVPPKADIDLRDAHVRFVPEADLRTPCAQGPMTPCDMSCIYTIWVNTL